MVGPGSSVDRIVGAARDEVGLWRCNKHDVPLEVFDDNSLYCPVDRALFELPNLTRQLLIVHLSDIHFGSAHRFAPPATAAGDVPLEPAFPRLIDKLVDDLGNGDPGCPVMYALTGDLAQTAAFDEFKAAEQFVRDLASRAILGKPRGLESIFIVPGNHDVVYASADVGERMQQWTDLVNRLYGTSLDRDKPDDFPIVHDRVEDLGAVIATLNSSIYVEKGKPDQDRGRVDTYQLSRLEAELERLDPQRLTSAIRIALIHHHPVLIPSLVEARHGYDAVHNSGYLLSTLRRFGFHLILHGHKHNPHVFTEDATSAYMSGDQRPILIAAGGSVGSTELPVSPTCGNSYNQISVKWHPGAGQTRVRVVARGLNVVNEDGSERLPERWYWRALRVDDRYFLGGPPSSRSERKSHSRSFETSTDATSEELRVEEYARLHGCFPVTEVRPSLMPGQAYEARVWLVHHRPPADIEDPTTVQRVTWSAGPRHEVTIVAADEDPQFATTFQYWGPMLVQARIEFDDGSVAHAGVYARVPRDT